MPPGRGRGDFKWGADAHEALAVALARMHGAIKPDEQEAILQDMKASGFETTWEAVRQHLQKLKKKDVDASATPSAPATPKKSGKATAAKAKTPTSSKRKAMINDNTDEDENDKVDLKKPKFEARDAKLDQSIDGDELQDGEC
ncbi:hypothetical protein SAMD00023353_1300050 [Rosellinia necatrix]|uniref:Uncharacterized protein n=1 Tax=Rosellinia necatrix TaxID=77044 RepID=A0A1W2TCM2_ROSNE|nr:hypothetical protein SAMD00023353_1300050 [Rosellinia necatrix]